MPDLTPPSGLLKGTYLAFDFGTRYLGLAVGQSITQNASPLTTLPAKNGIPNWLTLDKLIEEWQPLALIVGLPLQPDGSPSKTSKAAAKFGRRLSVRFQLPVYYIEERLTSVAAQERIKEPLATSFRQRDVDAMAAAIILESWFHSIKGNVPS